MKKANHDIIIDTLLWYMIWQLSGYFSSRAKQKLLRKCRRAYRSSWSRQGNQKSFIQTIPWNLASLVKNYPAIIVRQHHTDQKQMGLLREECVELRKGHLRYCCNQVWTKNGGRIPWNAAAICETFKIFCLMGRHLERRFGKPFNGPVIPFGAMVSLARCIPRLYVLYAVNVEGRHYGRRH